MTVDVVARGRLAAERRMSDGFRAHSPKPATARDADGFASADYDDEGPTPGRLAPPSDRASSSVDFVASAGLLERTETALLHLPASTPAPKLGPKGVGWEYELTALGPTTPSELLGSRWLAIGAATGSQQTARRLVVARIEG